MKSLVWRIEKNLAGKKGFNRLEAKKSLGKQRENREL